MLSIYTLKSPSDAMDYYKPQNYYTQDGEARSSWFGKGAALLGLEGKVDPQVFEALLYGRLPNGVVMRQTQLGLHHRPGYDLTFSAPKSVSILALVLGDKAVLQAHREAVKETLLFIEEKWAASRKKTGGPHLEKTGNFLFALFEEIDSRAGDPLLHTHSLLMNMTQMLDQAWHTIFGDFLYDEKMFCGHVYRSFLVQKLMYLGHPLRFEGNGLFEIEAFSPKLLAHFSKRSEQITTWMDQQGLEGGKAAQVANFQTRAQKQSVSPEERGVQWLEGLSQANSSLEDLARIVQEATQRGPIQSPDPYWIAQDSVAVAIAHLSERQATFSIQKLIKTADLMSLLPASDGDFLKAIEEQIKNKTLIYVEDKLLTTPEILGLEQDNAQMMEASKGRVQPILPGWIARFVADRQGASGPEQEALKSLLQSKDQQMMVRSSFQSILERVFKSFDKIAKNCGYYPRFLVQNTLRAESLKEKLGTEQVSVLQGFLGACAYRAAAEKTPFFKWPAWLKAWDKRIKDHEAREIWIVEGSVSFKAVAELQGYATQFGARLMFMQAGKGLSPALRTLESQGMPRLFIEAPAHYQADLTQAKQLLKALDGLVQKQALHCAASYAQRIDRALALYKGLDPARTRWVVSQESLRQRLNEEARSLLKEQGFLRGEHPTIQSLQRIALSHAQKAHAHLYQLGDVLRFSRSDPSAALLKDSYWTVKGVDLKTGLLSLSHPSQGSLLWDPAKAPVSANGVRSVEVFRPLAREVSVGEIIVWTHTLRDDKQRDLDRLKHQSALVMAVQGSLLQVRLENGQSLWHDTASPKAQHWDYGYAMSVKQLSLKGIDHFIVLQSHAIEASTMEAFAALFQGGLHQKKNFHWVTDDLPKLQETLEKGGLAKHQSTPLEQPYVRHEALAESQTTITQSVFPRLQGEYLKARELNPEFFAPNLENLKPEPDYSPGLRQACDRLEQVCLYHAERQAVLSVDELLKEASLLGGLSLSYTNLQAAFELALEKGWLVKVPDYENHEKVVCRHSLFLEKFCMQKMIEGQNQLNPLLPADAPSLQALQRDNTLTQGQRDAVYLVMTTPDRMVVVQGIAGAGKTTALKNVHTLCQSIGTQPLILANRGSAKNQAKQQYAGIQAMTSAQFLTRLESALIRDPDQTRKDFQHALIIVDESSMLSSNQLLRLQKIVDRLDVHFVLVGDFKQIGSIGSGTSMYDTLAYGVHKALMNENVRLKSPLAFQAMKQTYQGDIRGALRTLKDSIEEIPNKEEALKKMMKVYSALDPAERQHYVLVTPLNADRDTVNAGVRDCFKAQGELQGPALSMRVLLPIDQREAEKKSIQGYAIDQVLRFNIDHPRVAIKAGDYATITEVEPTHHRLTLKLENGQACYWFPKNLKKPSDIEVYEQSTRELVKDDLIIFKRNEESRGIFNGDNATIVHTEGRTFEAVLMNGQSVVLDASQSAQQHLDYGYAITPGTVQSRNVPFTIAYGTGFKPKVRERMDLAVGDRIALDPASQGQADPSLVDSKLVRITKLEKNAMHVHDAGGKRYVITESLERSWEHFPAYEDRKAREFPLAMSQEHLLVILSRGDGFCLFVPCVDDFQRLMEHKEKHQVSALSYFDPEQPTRDQAVKSLIATIRGKAEVQAPTLAAPKALAGPTPTQPYSVMASNTALREKPKTFAKINVEALNARLEGNLLGYAIEFLGRPKKLNRTDARWEGTLSLRLEGEKTGAWARWSTGDKGYGLVSLYAMVHDVSWKESIKALAALCGLAPEMSSHHPLSMKPSPVKPRDGALEQAAKQEKIKWAQTVYQSGIPVAGTLAEKYLREHRGIGCALPEDFRYSPALKHLDTKQLTPALMVPVRDKDHQITGMVRIFLNKDGSKLDERYRDQQGQWQKATAKANLGVAEGSAVIVQQGLGTLWVAEGIETALSIAQAMPHEKVVASTSVDRLRTIPVGPDIHTVVLCADKDEAGSQTFKAIIKAVDHHLSQGKKVFVAMPSGTEKCDFNDLMQRAGVLAVKEALDRRVEVKDLQILKAGGVEALFEKKQAIEPRAALSSESIASKVEIQKTMSPESLKQPLKGLDHERER